MLIPLAFGMPGPFEWLILAFFGLLLFGKRLPEVGRSIGKTIIEFKKGMKEVESEIHDYNPPASSPPQSQSPQAALPHKFDPYTGKPINQDSSTTVPPSA